MTDFSRYREVIAYSRYSSRLQARGTSESRQLDAVEAFARHHGLTISNRIDRGLSGYHGTNVSHGALGTLITELRDGLIPTPALLLIERQDRFGRRATTQTLLTLFGDLLGRGCDLYHLHHQRLYSTEIVDSDFGALVTLAAEIHAAHHYSATLSQRSAVAHQKARERLKAGEAVRIGWAPSWLEHTPDGWQFNDYAAVVRRLLALIENGHGYIATARQLNAEGLLSPRGKAWTAGSVTHLLQSPAIAGGRTMRRRAEVAWDYFPALLERNSWHGLLAAVSRRGAEYTTPTGQDDCLFIGQGITTCASCGRPVGSRVCSYRQRSTGQRILCRYVRCRGRLDGNCTETTLKLPDVTAHILTRLQPGQLASIIDTGNGNRLADLRRHVQRLQQRFEGAQAAVAATEAEMAKLMAAGDATTASVMARQVPALETQLDDARSDHQAALRQLQSLTDVDGLADVEQPVLDLQRSFAIGADTPEQRRAVNAAMRRLGLRISIRASSRAVGLSLGDGETVWQPLSTLDRPALWDGVAGWNAGRDSDLVVEPQLL